MADIFTKEKRSWVMSRVPHENTSIEVRLRKALWHKGYRYRVNYKKLPGAPDIAITKYRIAIFCDGEFFHGKDWDLCESKVLHGHNGKYWVKKIERNMQRDRQNESDLNGEGWTVLRFWGKDIQKHLGDCVRAVDEAVFEKHISET